MKELTIIGAGITGLTAGIYALKRHYKVTIYEKNAFPGGLATGWVKKGYYIDNCIHWLTGTNQKTKLFKEWKKIGAIDEATNLYSGKFFLKCILNSDEITLSKDLEKVKNDMIKLSKQDEKEIKNFTSAVNYLANYFKGNVIINNHFHLLKGYISYHKKSLEDLAKKFKHPLLQKIFTDYFPKDYSALTFIYAYSLFVSGNGKVPLEGSLNFAKNIEKKFLKLGGKINYNSEVERINIVNNKVESIVLNNKTTIPVKKLICAIDPYHLFCKLFDGKYMIPSLWKKLTNKNIKTMSSFHVAFLVDAKEKFIEDTTSFAISNVKVGKKDISRLLIRSFSYQNVNQNKTIYQAFIPQDKEDYDFFKSLDQKTYTNLKNEIASVLLQEIIKAYPNLEGKIEILDVWTPLTYDHYYHTFCGSYMGFVFTKNAKIKKFPIKIKCLKNVLVPTFWQRFMSGLPVALDLGKYAGKKI